MYTHIKENTEIRNIIIDNTDTTSVVNIRIKRQLNKI